MQSEEKKPYDPDRLLDTVIERMGLKNDAALARALCVGPSVISKIRGRRAAVGDSLLIRMHEECGLSIRELKALRGDTSMVKNAVKRSAVGRAGDSAVAG